MKMVCIIVLLIMWLLRSFSLVKLYVCKTKQLLTIATLSQDTKQTFHSENIQTISLDFENYYFINARFIINSASGYDPKSTDPAPNDQHF